MRARPSATLRSTVRVLSVLALVACGSGCASSRASLAPEPDTASPSALREDRTAWLAPEVARLAIPPDAVNLEGLAIDLGVGEAPYDDGPQPFAPERNGRPGFSDALLRASYEHRIAPGTAFAVGVSAFRVQDEPILRALSDLDVAWAVVGIRISF